jgi:hypothetical protein
MKNFIVAILVFSALSSQAQDQKQAVDSFSVIVSKFSNFIKSPQKLIYKQKYTDSPSGFVVEVIEYSGSNLLYDIKKTESIITPFVGYIEIDFTDKSNSVCGNVFYTISKNKMFIGWDTEKGALDNSNSLKCYEPQTGSDVKPVLSSADRVRFDFSYQNDKWVFKSAIRTDYNKPPFAISGALGLYSGPAQPLKDKESSEFNANWLTLIQ